MQHLRIFLSSPGDVSRERQLANEVIDRIESERAHRDKLKLEVVAWDKPGAGTAMPAQMEPQEAIDRGLKKPSECDIVIVIFWARMGTLLSEKYLKPDGGRYRSGTEYEFLDALNAAKKSGKPDVMVYRRKDPPDLKLRDPERKEKERQWELVEEFFAGFRNPDGSYRCNAKEYDQPSDFEKNLDGDLRDIITRHLDSHPPVRTDVAPVPQKPAWEASPFPGLRAFRPEEAFIFHGRGREIDALINKLSLSECRFISLVGASGSGKSSLVAAGLLPALEKDAIHGSRDWVWGRFTPGEVGDNPFMAFANSFKPALERHNLRPRNVAAELEENAKSFNKFLAMTLEGRPDWAELLIFIDQFEELFTLVDRKFQAPFVALLSFAANTARARTIVTMRSDFYHQCLQWPVLDALVAAGQYPLLAPGAGALHEMITRPAERAGLQYEADLAQRILDETGVEPGALALMAYALSELWQASKGGGMVMTHAAYDSFNGVPGAIGKRAEDTFKETLGALKLEEVELQAAMTQVFRDLIEVDERGVATRKRAQQIQVEKEAVAAALAKALIDSRLLVTSGEGKTPVVEVAHEAIFTHWPRLKNWIAATSDAHRLRRQVREAAAQWDACGQAKKYLWPDERVVEAADMLERLGLKIEDLSDSERCFLGPIDHDAMLAQLDDPATSHELRATIGVRLSLLGDPRPGVGIRPDGLPDIVWCKVPGGKVTLEEKAGTFNVKQFYIAKYLVTWKQYRAFLDADDGFKEPRWWKKLALEPSSPGRQFRQYDNHPVENVAWVEAVAFCRWFSAKLGCKPGYEVRLPTEWEWQQAATGGDPANEYPWGPWDSSRANTYESELQRSTAVGMYPQWISQVEALDMSGNLWEYCLNEYDNPKRIEVSGEKSRAVRGGCWGVVRGGARCAYRDDYRPNDRGYSIGFRLVCASPIF